MQSKRIIVTGIGNHTGSASAALPAAEPAESHAAMNDTMNDTSRIPAFPSIEAAPAASRPLLDAVHAAFGVVPNLFRVAAHSPAALEGLLGLHGALGKGAIDAATRERVALAIAEYDGCRYCLAAHAWLGARLAGLDADEIAQNRRGRSHDLRADAALRFARRVAETRGHVGPGDLAAVREAGYGDGELVELVALVALNVLTNYLNEVAQTDIDFPVPAEPAAA